MPSNSQPPLVSVIIPSYNHEKYIEKCIDSIVEQTYPNIQLIIVDDGSRDGSPALLKELQKKHKFELVLQENKGLADSINHSHLHLAKGKYIVRIDSDDYMEKNRIARQVAFLEENPHIDLVYGKYHVVDKDGNITGSPAQPLREGYVFEDIFLGKFNMHICTIMHTKKSFEKIGPIPEKFLLPDAYLKFKISEYFQVGYIDEIVAYHRRHGANHSILKNYLELTVSSMQLLGFYKTSHPELYARAYKNFSKNYFVKLSVYNKKEAVGYLKTAGFSPYDRRLWIGLIKLLTPIPVYDYLVGKLK